MTDKFIDPKTQKEMFRINDENKETFSDDFKKKNNKDRIDGTDNNDKRITPESKPGEES